MTNRLISHAFNLLLIAGTSLAIAGPTTAIAQEKTQQEAVQQVNINEADAESIADVLVGIGVTKAQAIVQFREEHGPFTSIDQLLDVNGIGQSTLSNNRQRIVLE